ncbi:nuclear transport factor 2 family protein [Streptomyces flavofungini]|uniref:nuclear transport factor 2 family protein n=1 Tax=Streptomyces flavofungini TaxID=68200 RepID=UPI0025AFDDB5|nr:nuclear transport factor 2 family protein [Streptomyces flavofungini]WJV44589.1 nuclear transport factor 2 family protein [Streptomyces flavofungini]
MTTTAPTPEALFAKIDGKELHAVAELLAENATMVFGNGDPLVGRAAILAANTAFMETIAALRHRIVDSWVVGATTIAVTEVTYTRLDTRQVTLPAVTIWRVGDDGLIVDFRVVLDLTPVYAP